MLCAKKNVNDLAILDSNMGHLKKQIAKDMQQNNTEDWVARLPKILKGHNKTPTNRCLTKRPTRCTTNQKKSQNMPTQSLR